MINKIGDLVGEGVRNIGEMKRHLKIYVKETLFNGQEQPNRNNRRYFPRMKTIRNHMYNATVRSRLSALDQDNVKLLIDNWTKENPEDNFFYRPYKESESGDLLSMCTGSDKNSSNNELEELEECDDEVIITKAGKQEDRLLFVHQTVWQSRLLLKYGQDLAFLDATYKTTKYALPLFFIAVKTNVDYIIVASFVVQDETTESIQEALSIIKQWNPEWRPQNFMTDLCEEEINALESTFPGTVQYIYYRG